MSAEVLTFGRQRVWGALDRWLLWLSVACSAVYFFSKPWQPFLGQAALKGSCVALLAALAWHLLRTFDGRLLGAALAFSALGDVLLDLSVANAFIYGLGAFLVAHLLYAGLFLRQPRPSRLSNGQWALLLAVLVYGLALTAWLWPGLGGLKLPVGLYICAITLMVETAMLAQFSQRWIILGALLFLLSDSLLGINKFKTPVPLRDYLVWATYYLGQCGIALGFLRAKLGATKTR